MRVTLHPGKPNIRQKMEWESGQAILADSPFVEIPEEELMLLPAVRYGDLDMVSRLINHGTDINSKHAGKPCLLKLPYLFRNIRLTNYACLHIAVLHSNIKLINYLLDHGADVNILDGNDRTPLYLATAVGRLDIVDLLLSSGADTDIQTSSKRTAVMEAVCKQDLPIVQRLIEFGCNLNLTDIKGACALYFACILRQPNLDIIKEVLEGDVDVNKANSKGATVLMMIVRNSDMGVVKLLCEAGADIHLKDSDNKTALHLALENIGSRKSTEVIDYLLCLGADINTPDRKGDTPLQKAVKYGKLRCIERLLKADCDRSYDVLVAARVVQLCAMLPKFNAWLQEEFYTPRSLLRLCRSELRKNIFDNVGSVEVRDLDIPQFLKDFLLVKHYTEIEL